MKTLSPFSHGETALTAMLLLKSCTIHFKSRSYLHKTHPSAKNSQRGAVIYRWINDDLKAIKLSVS